MDGIENDRTQALTIAANRGDTNAQHALGEWHRVGLGVPKDYAAALAMHERAIASRSCRNVQPVRQCPATVKSEKQYMATSSQRIQVRWTRIFLGRCAW